MKRRTKAPQAAGVIHTDFERGFIKAEVCNYDDIIGYGGYVKAKENETVSRFLEKLENLPNLSHEELEQLSKKIKEIKS